MKVVFSILHYNTYEDTRDCVDSLLLNIEYCNYSILIIDNGSNNKSYEKLNKVYSQNKNVYIIQNESNLGFAKGNNVGFNFAKKNLKADFIIMLNNDTMIQQKKFIDVMLNLYENHKFNILGPDILSTIDSQHQNPQRIKGLKISEVKKIIFKLNLKLILNILNLENGYIILEKIIKKVFKVRIKKSGYKSNFKWKNEMFNVQLHGACLIFDSHYIEKYNGLYSNTFMYAEEDILYFIAQKENLKVFYTPQLQIFHKEASSTNKVYTKKEEKRKFMYYHSKKSLIEILRMEKNSQVYIDDILSKEWRS
jgi:GT2 family glycosyltransferase